MLNLGVESEGRQFDNNGQISVIGKNELRQTLNGSTERLIESKTDVVRVEKGGDISEMVASLSGNEGSASLAKYNSELPQMSAIESRYEKLSNFDWHLKLDESNKYWLDWRVEYEANKIIFSLGINESASDFRKGYDIFALGFSNYGLLNSSDFCFIWYDLSHKIHLQDARTDKDNKLELLDTSESVCKLLKAPKNHHSRLRTRDVDFVKLEERDINHLTGKKELMNDEEVDEPKEQIEIVFERPLDVCSSNDYYTIDNGTTHLVWFTMRGPLLTIDDLNLSDFAASSSSSSSQKSNKSSSSDDQFEFGLKRVQLIATKAITKLSDDYKQINSNNKQATAEFRMDNFKIQAKETTYWCKLFKLDPKFESRKYHVTKYEAVIDSGNEHVVHHMELFNCANLNNKQESDLKNLYENKGGWSGDCNGLDRPKETEPCRRVILAWAMGAHPLEYPEQVGQSIGGHKYSPYVVLEIHYNNVKFTPNLVDNSGLKFHYTSKLRPYDAGILEVGLEYTEKNSIPPNMITPIAGYCVSECTRAAMSSLSSFSTSTSTSASTSSSNRHKHKQKQPSRRQNNNNNIGTIGEHYSNSSEPLMVNDNSNEGSSKVRVGDGLGRNGIYIFAAQMHTHLAGIASWTEHIRGGKLLNELQRDNHYSPHFQEIRLLPKQVHVLPGDALIHYCLYDTTKRTKITLGGYSTSEEMCVTYLHYYPKIDLEVCKSSIDTKALESYFAYLAREENQNTSLRLNESVVDSSFDLKLDEKSGNGMSGRSGNDYADDYDTDNNHSTAFKVDNRTLPKSISENYNSIEWSTRRSRELIQFYSQAPLSVQCNRSNGERFPGYWNGIAPTQLWVEKSAWYNSRSTTNWDGFKLVGYRGSRRFNRRHTHCLREGKPGR